MAVAEIAARLLRESGLTISEIFHRLGYASAASFNRAFKRVHRLPPSAYIEPLRFFSFRWHPFAIDPKVDYSREPATLVAFQLEEVAGGTKLVISESGFDRIPLERRAKAFTANEQGWTAQAKLIEKYVTGPGRP